MRRIWTPPGDVRSIRGALRLAGPGAVGALGALAAWLLVVQESDAPFLGNLIIDASSSVLSPSGFSVALDIVGQAGKALTLATTIAMQFLLFVLLWAWGTQYVQARDGWGTRWRFGAIQLGVAVALLVIAAAIFDLAAASSVFSAGDWWTYLWQTVFFTTLFLTVAHALDRFAAPARPAVATPATAADAAPARPPRRAPLLERGQTRRSFLAMAGGLAVFVTAAVFVGRVVTDTAATGVRRVFLGQAAAGRDAERGLLHRLQELLRPRSRWRHLALADRRAGGSPAGVHARRAAGLPLRGRR